MQCGAKATSYGGFGTGEVDGVDGVDRVEKVDSVNIVDELIKLRAEKDGGHRPAVLYDTSRPLKRKTGASGVSDHSAYVLLLQFAEQEYEIFKRGLMLRRMSETRQ